MTRPRLLTTGRRAGPLTTALLGVVLVALAGGPAAAAPTPTSPTPTSPTPTSPTPPATRPQVALAGAAVPPFGYRTVPLVTATGRMFYPSQQGNPISTAGRVAGYTFTTTGGTQVVQAAIFYLGNRTMRVLRPPGSSESYAMDINNRGQVTGSAGRSDPVHPDDDRHQAFVWSPSTNTYRMLGTLGGAEATGRAINDAGVVVGSSTYGGAFDYRSRARLRDLGLLDPGDLASSATGVNTAGDVIGFSATLSGAAQRAFLWRPRTGRMVDLGSFPGDNMVSATDINDRGVIVGGSGYQSPDNDPEAFRPLRPFVRPPAGQLRALPVADSTFGIANAINVHGVIVGANYTQRTSQALIWNACGTPSAVLAETDHSLASAYGVNRYERVVGEDGDSPVIWRRPNGRCL